MLTKFKQSGQSLLEITITLGISVVIILAIAITTIQGLLSSQLSQNQTQATKYAQEGLEKIRLLKTSNVGITIRDLGQTYFWVADAPATSLIWNLNVLNVLTEGDLKTVFEFPPNCVGLQCVPVNVDSQNDPGEQVPFPNGRFYRKITMVKSADNSLKVTAVVTWKDVSGDHESRLVTVLTNN